MGNVEIHSQKYLCTCPCTFDCVMHPYFSSSAEKEHVLHAGDPSYTSAPTLPIRISVPSLLYVQQIFLLFLRGIKPLGLGLDTTSVLSAINSVSGAKTDGF